jgi:hypothetical protein
VVDLLVVRVDLGVVVEPVNPVSRFALYSLDLIGERHHLALLKFSFRWVSLSSLQINSVLVVA